MFPGSITCEKVIGPLRYIGLKPTVGQHLHGEVATPEESRTTVGVTERPEGLSAYIAVTAAYWKGVGAQIVR